MHVRQEHLSARSINNVMGYDVMVIDAKNLLSKQFKAQRDVIHETIKCPMEKKVELIKNYENERQTKKAIG